MTFSIVLIISIDCGDTVSPLSSSLSQPIDLTGLSQTFPMNKLSFELIEQIASYLDVGDAVALSATFRIAREACRVRIDPERYLQTTFQHPRYLLAAMTDYGCIISGSRALEYFIPGSINQPPAGGYSADAPPSDWDFLVPCIERSVLGMMGALEKCGVEWVNPMAEVFSLVDKPAGSVASFNSESLSSASWHLADSSPELAALYRQLYDFVQSENLRGPWVSVEVLRKPSSAPAEPEPGPRYKLTEVPLEDEERINIYTNAGYPDGQYNTGGTYPSGYGENSPDLPIHMINGYIRPPGGYRQKVQLFQCHSAPQKASTPLEYVVNTYYATHVQCFISGWSAGHFFYDLVRQRLALIWAMRKSKSHRKSVELCIRKYRSRGYRFFDAAEPDVQFDDHLERARVPHEHVEEPVVALRNIVRHFNNACDSETMRDKFVAAIGPAVVDMAIAEEAQGYAARAAAVAAAAAASSSLLTSMGLYNDTSHKPGTLSMKTYKTLQAAASPVSGNRLGMEGTLLIRFRRLHDGIWQLSAAHPDQHHAESKASDFEANPGSSESKEKMLSYDKILSASISQFAFAVRAGKRPLATEPEVEKGLRGRYMYFDGQLDNSTNSQSQFMPQFMPSLCSIMIQATAAGRVKGNRAAPDTAVLDSDMDGVIRRENRWRYHRRLLSFTPRACFRHTGYCDYAIKGFMPPQI